MRPPARIKGVFAKKAPICVIIRRGPSRYSQMILWHTDTDVFEPGQWIRGHVEAITLSLDGKYAAVKVMGTRTRINSWEDTQQAIVCRPPYFTALEVYIGGLCFTHAYFQQDGRLLTSGDPIVNAKNQCPIERWPDDHFPAGCYDPDPSLIDATRGPAKGTDQSGRVIAFKEGKVFAVEGDSERLLFDSNLYSFEQVIAPDWAKEW